VVVAELAELGAGQLAVIGPAGLSATLTDRLPAGLLADQRLSVLTAGQAKGLEFDVVVLLEPAAIMAESAARAGHGVGDLYVAMTRCTQRLRVLHQQPLPVGLAAHPGR
jgi:superfamily I DNA/RNA helicase